MHPSPVALFKRSMPVLLAIAIALGSLLEAAPASSARKCTRAKTRSHVKRGPGGRRCPARPRSPIQARFDQARQPAQAPSTVAAPSQSDAALPPAQPFSADSANPESPPEAETEPEPATPEPPDEDPEPLAENPEPPDEGTEPAGEGVETHFRFFSPAGIWNAEAPAAAPLDPDSVPIVAAFDSLVESELTAKTGPSINTTESSVPIYTMPADQPTVPVELTSSYAASALRSAWSAVPLPPDAQPARGNDHHLVVWQPSTDRLWEFWEMTHDATGWQAAWGGAMLHASESSGVYDTAAWPGATQFWGASASSLSIAGGLITFEDLEKGSIEHALSMSIPNVRAGVYSSPAQRGDGKSPDPLSLPEGAHLRIDPNLDLASLHLPRLTLILAEAAQRYGIFVRDGSRTVTFQAQDPTPTGHDPYRGPSGFWEGSYPRAILAPFPWSHLQLLQMDLHANPGT